MNEELMYEENARYDYLQEAFGATADDCARMAMQDYWIEADEAAAAEFLAGEICARGLSDKLNDNAKEFGGKA